MGLMKDTSQGQINATIELLDSLGVESRHLLALRKAPREKQEEIATAIKNILCLRVANERIELGAVENFDPAFFETREGLWVSNDFERLVRSQAKKISNLPSRVIRSFDLERDAYDREITPNLPEKHEFEISELLARIAQMIERQWGAKAGELLNNGRWNLFYLAGFVVGVHWRRGYRAWSVCVWKRDGNYWSADDRAFSSN